MMYRLFILIVALLSLPAWAEVQLSSAEHDAVDLEELAKSTVKNLTAAPSQDSPLQYTSGGLVMTVDGVKYYIKPVMFMAKSKPDDVCKPIPKSLTYRCEEGQPFVKGCHLLFFDAQGKWVGWKTMAIQEAIPHYCNAMPAMGVANKANNEILITMQYFLPDEGKGAKKVSELGDGWYRMTSLLRVKAVDGKIEAEQDDACLGNPNRLDTIAKARKQLQQCAKASK